MLSRREFTVNLSTAAAATLAALATPFRLLAGSKPAPAAALVSDVSPDFSDAEVRRILNSFPCRALEKFVLTWNIPYPHVEEIQVRLAEIRQWKSPTGDTKWEQERVRRVEKELASAVRLRAEDPAGYAVALGRRVDFEVTRPEGAGDRNSAEWRLLEWLVTDWAAEWLTFVGDNGDAYLFDDWRTWVHNGLRCATVTSHADLIEVTADLAAMRDWLRQARHAVTEIGEDKDAYKAMERTGWSAAFDAAFDACSVLDNMTEEILLLLWDIVEACVAASGVTDFAPVAETLRLSAIEMLGELNAERDEEEADTLADAA